MYFNVFFALASSLCFTVDYEIKQTESIQDFFVFSKVDPPNQNTAHFFKKNNTLTLHLQSEHGMRQYDGTVYDDLISLEWCDGVYLINDKPMTLTKQQGSVVLLYDTFTLLNPHVRLYRDCVAPEIEPIYKVEDTTNYGIISAIVFAVAVMMKFHKLVALMVNRFKSGIKSSDSDSYVSMEFRSSATGLHTKV